MSILEFFLASLIVFVGIPTGIIVGKIAKEELKDGKKYFLRFQSILFALIVFFVLELYKVHIVISIIASLLVLFLSIKIKEKYAYIIFAVVLALSIKRIDFFVIESALIFLYGLPTGSLIILNCKYKIQKSLLGLFGYVHFLIISNLLFVLYYFLK